jgi:hypothetical protein|tara:strand:+ start:341 stop:562 length:222 start_codon:yes stop_codon:yes gene_type:complete
MVKHPVNTYVPDNKIKMFSNNNKQYMIENRKLNMDYLNNLHDEKKAVIKTPKSIVLRPNVSMLYKDRHKERFS